MSKTVAVVSGKGGVGKTTVCVLLGEKLSAAGMRVVLVDMDTKLNNLLIVSGAEQTASFDVFDCVLMKCRPKQALTPLNASNNFFVLTSESGFRREEEMPEFILKRVLDGLKYSFDYVLIDCPAGLNETVKRVMNCTEEIYIVVTPQMTSLVDAGKVKMLAEEMGKTDISLIINKFRGDLVADRTAFGVGEISQKLNLRTLAVIPEDDGITSNVKLINRPELKSAKAFRLAAKNIMNGTNKLCDYVRPYRGVVGNLRRKLKKSL